MQVCPLVPPTPSSGHYLRSATEHWSGMVYRYVQHTNLIAGA
jgi:hypothetical protein